MQTVHNQPFDQAAEGFDKFLCTADLDNRVDNGFVVRSLVRYLSFFCDQFLNDVGKLLRKSFSHFRAGIFGGYALAYLDQPIQGDLVPVTDVGLLFFDQ